MTSDNFAVRVVVVTLALGTLGSLASISYLAFTGTAIPDQLDRLAFLIAGAIVGTLARTSSGAEQVEVVNTPADPVQVEQADE